MTALIQMTNEWLSLLHTLLRKSFLFSPLTEIRYEMPLSDFIFEEKIADFLSHSKSHTAAAAAAGYSRLLVVDFDSTLFCSPLPNPELWSSEVVGSVISNCNWFQQLKTLSFPYIPDIPGPDWWDGGVVDTVMNANIDDGSNTNSKTLKILLTGRLDSIFSPRIHHLIATCSCGNLDFDFIFMKETHDLHGKPRFNTTIDFKFALLEHLLASFPFIKSVQLLDDRKQHIELFTKFLGNYVTDSTDTTTSAVTPSSSASSSASLPPLPRLNSFQVQLVLHPHHQAKYIQSESLERELVFSLIEKCNKRILDAREREQRSSSVDSLASEGSFQIIDGDEVSSLAASDDDEYGDEGDEDCCDGDNDHHHLLHTSTITPSKSFSLSSSSTTSPTMSVCSSTQSPPLEAGGSISTSVDAETFTRRSINSVTATKPRYHRHTKSSVTSVSSNLNPINTMKTTLSHDALQKQLQQQAHLQIPASVKKLDVTNQQQQQQQQRQRQSSKLRRKSVSLFKTLIELEEEVNRTCVRLDQESTALLISRFQSLLPNNEWTLLSQELVICFGEACPNFIAKLGGLGSRLELQVVSYANGVGDVDVIAVSVDQARCVTGGGTEESHVVRFNSEEIHQTSSIKLQSPTILANTTTNESHIPPMTESPLSVLTEDEGGGVGGGGPAEGLNLEDDPMVGGGNTILLVPVQLQPQHQQPLPREKSLRSSIVKSMSSGQLPWGGSGLPHIVVAISPKARQRDAAKIKQNEWISLHPQPLLVQGTLTTVTKVGLKNGKRVRKEAALAKQQRRDVRIGFLVVKHHPQLVGRQIAIAVRHVENWMSKTFMDNIERNRPFIEAFVCEMNCGQVLLAAQEQEEKGVMSPLKVGQSFFDGLNQIMNK